MNECLAQLNEAAKKYSALITIALLVIIIVLLAYTDNLPDCLKFLGEKSTWAKVCPNLAQESNLPQPNS